MKDAGLRAQRENDSTIRDSQVGDPDPAGATSSEWCATGIATNRCGAEEEGEEMAAGEISTSGRIAKVFRDLTVYGDSEILDGIIPGIERRLADGWSRDRESEQRLLGAGGQSRFFLFVCRASAELPAVKLAMCAEGRRLSVADTRMRSPL
jgi:hypothetical protein